VSTANLHDTQCNIYMQNSGSLLALLLSMHLAAGLSLRRSSRDLMFFINDVFITFLVSGSGTYFTWRTQNCTES